jgi:hypothetical protein
MSHWLENLEEKMWRLCVVLSHSLVGLTILVAIAPAQVAINQTEGFGEGQELVFTYLQQYYCTHQPFQDLNHNGKLAAVDPQEFQRPICVVGKQPTIDPTGAPISQVEKLWVIVPFFGNDKNPDHAFNPTLGQVLLNLFGFIPEAFKTHPSVPVQCPEPGLPETRHKGAPGTCTMHTTRLDLGPPLAKMGKVSPNTTVFVPSPNHSHILDETNKQAVWWQVISVLVTDPSVWPDEEGTKGINSIDALRAAQAAHKALPDAPTNFFLFFSAHPEHFSP